MVEKTLPIAKAFYAEYSLYFVFDNAINYSAYRKNVF